MRGSRPHRKSPSGVPARYRDTECACCDSDLADYEPVFLEETEDGECLPAGAFCNYGRLVAHVTESGLADGAACSWDPDG